jgi:ribonuclease VapC
VIAVDTSALLEILFGEPLREACLEALDAHAERTISAGTLTEAFVASEYKGSGEDMLALIAQVSPSIQPVTLESACRAREAFRRWGKGRHPAGLNFGDCFSYVVAAELDCPLLFIGNDFARTDIRSVL